RTDFGEPREVAGCPHPGIAPRQCMVEFLDPTRNNPLDVEVSVWEVPFCVWDDLDLSSADISVKMRHSLYHSFSGVFFIQGVRCQPQTKFMILQPRFEIRNQQVNQAGFGLVKLAEVRAPRCLIHTSDSHRSQLFLHVLLPHLNSRIDGSVNAGRWLSEDHHFIIPQLLQPIPQQSQRQSLSVGVDLPMYSA